MSNIRFSQLPTVQLLKDSDILAISSPDTSTPPVYTSAQSPISQVAAKIVEDTTFTTSLNTTNKTVAGSINETLSNFANEYSTSSTYAVGDCVLYAGSIYQCTTAIPSGEAWDSTHWTQIKAVDVGSGGGGGVHYSLNEQVVGTWIDGSPLYEKTIARTFSGDEVYTVISSGIDIAFVTSCFFEYTSGSNRYMSPYYISSTSTANNISINSDIVNGALTLVNQTRLSRYYVVTVRYTKSST